MSRIIIYTGVIVIEYLYKSVLMSYILELAESDPGIAYTMKELYKELGSGRFDAKNIQREQDELFEQCLKAKEAIETFGIFMKKMGVKK